MKRFWWGIVKNKCSQSGFWTLKLTVSEEWTDGVNWLFVCWYVITKIKSWSKIFWIGMVKNGCGLSRHMTQKWTDWIKSFFHAGTIQLFLGVLGQKWPLLFSSRDPKIYYTLRISLWTELIFWMLIVMQ